MMLMVLGAVRCMVMGLGVVCVIDCNMLHCDGWDDAPPRSFRWLGALCIWCGRAVGVV